MIEPPVAGRDPGEVRRRVLELRQERLRRQKRGRAQQSIAYAITRWWPWFILEEIHLLICGYLEALEQALIDRAMVFMPPRTGKSRIASIVLPAHYLGNYPGREVMQAGHSQDLSLGFGRDTRRLVRTSEYLETFPKFQMAPDSTAAGRWNTIDGGGYFATGITGGIAGKGFHLGVIDDPLSEQNARSKLAQEFAFNWYGAGFYTRQSAEVSAILAMGTRWDKNDLFGRLLALKAQKDDEYADEWSVLKIPAILDRDTAEMLNEVADDPLLRTERHPKRYRFRSGDSFAPRRWPLKKLLRIRANQSSLDWEALYQQEPTVEEGAILKRSWWRKWPGKTPPKCFYVLQVYDTAFSEEDQKDNAYTARTTWGVFEQEDRKNKDGIVLPSACVILLERFNKRVGFPELRKEARDSYELYKPDRVLIEKKASGHSLLQEMRRWNVPLTAVKADVDKVSRAYAASGVLEHGFVYYMDRQWANDVIDQCAEFPTGGFSDLVDTCVMSWLWLRKTMHLQQRITEKEEKDGVDLMPRRLYG